MFATTFLGLMALTVVAALPSTTERSARYGRRAALMQRAQFNFLPFELTNVTVDCARPDESALYACKLNFDWFDPNSVRQNNLTTCTCTSNWSWDGETVENGALNSYDTRYHVCCQAKDNPTVFQMKTTSFESAENFSLELAHRYQDSENFTAPYIYPKTFATPQLSLKRSATTERNRMVYSETGPFQAPIVGLTA